MKLFKTYKHKTSQDVAVYIAMIMKEYEDSTSMIVHWISVSGTRQFIVCQELINIKHEDFCNWEEIEVKFS